MCIIIRLERCLVIMFSSTEVLYMVHRYSDRTITPATSCFFACCPFPCCPPAPFGWAGMWAVSTDLPCQLSSCDWMFAEISVCLWTAHQNHEGCDRQGPWGEKTWMSYYLNVVYLYLSITALDTHRQVHTQPYLQSLFSLLDLTWTLQVDSSFSFYWYKDDRQAKLVLFATNKGFHQLIFQNQTSSIWYIKY